jgi:low affinity Fe/Cu permease
MLLFIFVIGTGGWFMLATGLVMLLASFSYAIIIQNDPPIFFPFADDHGELVRLFPNFGWSWYLNLVTGIAVVVMAIIVLAMNYFFPRHIAVVFHHSVVEEDDFFQVCLQ